MPRIKQPPRIKPIISAIAEIAEVVAADVGRRFNEPGKESEKPKDVIDGFVADVARSMEDRISGVQLCKRDREIKIRRADLTYSYYFQANARNAAGVSISVFPHASVSSKTLLEWRKACPYSERYFGGRRVLWRGDASAFIFGMLGNFFVPHDYISLRLLRSDRRARELTRVADLIFAVDQELQQKLATKEGFFEYAASPDFDIVCRGNAACEYISARWGDENVRDFAQRVGELNEGGLAMLSSYLAMLQENPETNLPINQIAGCAEFINSNALDWRRA